MFYFLSFTTSHYFLSEGQLFAVMGQRCLDRFGVKCLTNFAKSKLKVYGSGGGDG